MIHELKIRKQWADAKLAGEKPFEIRINDRGFQKGDTVRYRVIDPKTGEPWRRPMSEVEFGNDNLHPLEKCDFVITYVREGADGLEKGYCVYADCPVPKKAPEGPDGSARVRGETFSGSFMRITKGGLGAMEKALDEHRRSPPPPSGVVHSECDRYEPDDSFLIVGEKPCKHYNPVARHDATGTGTCKCPGCIHCGHECPTRGGRSSVTVHMSSPVSADLGSGATPSNGTAEPLAPPSPLADASDKEVHTEKSVPKSSKGCKCFATAANGSCIHMRRDVDGTAICTCAESERKGLPCRR